MTSKKHDVTFVLGPPAIKYPTGGEDVVYRLASGLNKLGIDTSIVFLINPNKLIPNYVYSKKKRSIKYKIFLISLKLMHSFLFEKIYHHYDKIAKLLKIDYDYAILKNVPVSLSDTRDKPAFKTKIIIATAWSTAYFVKKFEYFPDVKALYLVQNSEDDPSFSGKNSENARKTYEFNFKKIVINKKVYNRFRADKPYFFHVGINTDFYKRINKDKREYVMFPLRRNESKGAKYAFEVIERLLSSYPKIKITSFGNFKTEEIPINIRNKIEYIPNPTNKVLLDMYNKSMIFCLPSLVEGMSLPPLEAMACGCAVVVTNNGGTDEYIEDGVNGISCPIKDSNCLFNAIVKLLEDNNLREKLVKNGCETSKQFSYDNMIHSFYKIINEILNS